MKRRDAIESGRLALTDDATDTLWSQLLEAELADTRCFRFDSQRRWHFDFCWPARMIAVEVESCTAGVKNAKLYRNDLEKYNTAALLGYRVFRFSPQDVRQGRAIELLRRALAPNRNQETQADGIPAGTTASSQLERLYEWIRDIREHFSREMDQALLKRDLYLGMEAMGGRDACDRIKRNIESRFHMDENWIEQTTKPAKAPLPSWHRQRKRRSAV